MVLMGAFSETSPWNPLSPEALSKRFPPCPSAINPTEPHITQQLGPR